MPASTLPESRSLSSAPVTARSRSARGGGWMTRVARRLVLQRLSRVAMGELRLEESGVGKDSAQTSAWRFGHPAEDGLYAQIVVRDPRFWVSMVTGGALGAAEAYAEGWWHAEDLTSVVRIFARNRSVLQR
ncbi:MAG: hypothetical protein ACYSU1_06930, partial [Planctomycetota bacterium]